MANQNYSKNSFLDDYVGVDELIAQMNEKYPKGSRMERDWDFWKYRYNTPHLKRAVDEYYKISEKYNLNMSQMSLKFLPLLCLSDVVDNSNVHIVSSGKCGVQYICNTYLIECIKVK